MPVDISADFKQRLLPLYVKMMSSRMATMTFSLQTRCTAIPPSVSKTFKLVDVVIKFIIAVAIQNHVLKLICR